MAPASRPKSGQLSIAAMFGAKDTSLPATTNKNSASNATNNTKKSAAKSKSSVKQTSLMTAGRLARTPYYKLQPIDPQTYHDSLSAEFKELLALELDPEHGLGPSYLHVLRAQLTQQYFLDLKRFLLSEGLNQPRNDIYPSAKNIYHWSRATPLDQIRVVIIGQDPYHGPGQAHGLSFSVPKGIPIPGSLRNIYDEIKQEYPEFKKPAHGTLHSWAKSGVLLLNTSLTVKKGLAGSHSQKGWEQFTDAVVDAIDLYGGLGLLSHKKTSEIDSTIEPSAKRAKVDHSAEAEPQPCLPDDDQARTCATGSEDLMCRKQSPPPDPQEIPSTEEKAAVESHVKPAEISAAQSDTKGKRPAEVDPVNDAVTSPASQQQSESLAGFGKGVVFLCWGKWAADRVARLSDSKHLILKSAHPSPLSAHRGFLGNNHFKLANEWLEKKYDESAKIDWCKLEP